jgi:DNA replication protein DnaC
MVPASAVCGLAAADPEERARRVAALEPPAAGSAGVAGPLAAGEVSDVPWAAHVDSTEAAARCGRCGYAHEPVACAVCHDFGWVVPDLRPGEPGFGRAVPCVCGRLETNREEARRAQSGLPANLAAATFATFVPGPGTRPVLAAAVAFARELHPPWLVLFGGTGVGKTHLCAAVCNSVLGRGGRPRYWSLPHLLKECQAPGLRGGEEVPFAADDALTRAAEGAELLVLDEVLSVHAGDWGRAKLELILDRRYAPPRPTVLAMTGRPHDLAAWSPRIASRCSDRAVAFRALLTGDDFRPRRVPTRAQAHSRTEEERP